MKTYADQFRDAPDGHLADSLKPLLDEWDEPPKAVQLLKMLDWCVYVSGASPFVMTVFNIELEEALKREGTNYVEISQIADKTWRKEEPFEEAA